MALIFEGNGASGAVSQDSADLNKKAFELNELVTRISKEVFAIDDAITTLALKGLQGSAMSRAVDTYVENREVINGFVKRFAAVACALSESAIATSNINEEAAGAAKGEIM